jgi:F-type H+-transporting ATPase subunit b
VELDWSTFLLEIVNVLVLVWLLKRFLFRPVMKVIEDRKAAIAKTLADATRVQTEAESARERYEQRLVTWNDEQAKSRVQLQEELAAERQRRLAALQKELEREHEQASVRELSEPKSSSARLKRLPSFRPLNSPDPSSAGSPDPNWKGNWLRRLWKMSRDCRPSKWKS